MLRLAYRERPVDIVLDNASIHTKNEVTALLDRKVYLAQYLPPYSPDYNPMVLTFAVRKAWIRRNWYYPTERFEQ